MGIKERIKELRKYEKLSQSEFAAKLGLQQKAISQIELGINNITEQNIIAICCVFKINEEWLRNGIGEMRQQTDENLIDEITNQFHLGAKSRELMQIFLEFDEEQREAIIQFIDDFTAKWQARNKPPNELEEQLDTADEAEVLKKYRSLSEQAQERIQSQINLEYEQTKNLGEESSDEAI